MGENARKRKSKWDVMSETHVPSKIRQDDAPPIKAVDSFKNKESNSDLNSARSDINKFSKWSDLNTILFKDSSEADQSSKLSEPEDENIRESKECSAKPQSPKCSDMEAGDSDGSKRSFWEPMSGQTTAKNGNWPESLKHPDVKDGDRGGSMCLGLEPIAENQTAAKDGSVRRETDEWGKGLGPKYNTSMSSALNASLQHSRSTSPRSGRSWSCRSRSRSRSRSPSRGLKHKSERWVERGRTGGGSATACRDFAAGRCRRGSQCRHLHEDGGRRHFDRCTADPKESRCENGRYSGHDNKGNFTDSWEHRDHTRDRPDKRHESRYDNDRERPEPHRNYRSTERCYDFTQGRCYRGSSCRYAHHDTSTDGGFRNMKDEARERPRDRKDLDASCGRRVEPHRVSDAPCKYFAEGRCHDGEGCKFSHEGGPYGQPEGTDYSSSRAGPNWGDQTVAMDATESAPWMSDDNGSSVAAAQSTGPEDNAGHKPQYPQSRNPQDNRFQMLSPETPQKALSSQQQNTTDKGTGQYLQVPTVSAQVMAENASIQQPIGIKGEMLVHEEMNSANNPLSANGQSQYMVLQPLHAQSLTPNAQIQQAVPPLPFNGQMPQIYSLPPNGIGQFAAPSNPQDFNLILQSQPVLPPLQNGQDQQNFSLNGEIQQNRPVLHIVPNQQNLNLSGQIQNLPPPHNEQSQQNFNLGGQMPQNLPAPHDAPSKQILNFGGQIQSLPPPQIGQSQPIFQLSGQIQQCLPLSLNGQNQQYISSDEQNHKMNSQIQSNTHHHTQQIGVDESTTSEIMPPSQSSSDAPITQKAVTSEQAAQITNLSASLARFFGNGQQLPQLYATLNPHVVTGMEPLQPFSNPGATGPLAPLLPSHESWAQQQPDPITNDTEPEKSDDSDRPPGFSSVPVERKDPRLDESQTSLRSSVPGSTTNDTIDGNQGNHEPKLVEMSGDTASKEIDGTETGQSKRGQTTHSEDANADVRTDGESRRSKDAKGVRMFRCALVEFVKDYLKPAWKDGHLSKEVHKTIVKKVVEKVTGAMQASNIPQTQEKIDVYLAFSKDKLNKLVQVGASIGKKKMSTTVIFDTHEITAVG